MACRLPEHAFLRKYEDGVGYADCYVTEVAGTVSQARFVEAFYTTGLFKIERVILALFAARPSTDADAARLANGSTDMFAAWRVEARTDDQLLLADFTGRTRSWLTVSPLPADGRATTRLYFGSAVVPRAPVGSGKPRMGFPFNALLGFHRLYSRLLLRAARSRLQSNR